MSTMSWEGSRPRSGRWCLALFGTTPRPRLLPNDCIVHLSVGRRVAILPIASLLGWSNKDVTLSLRTPSCRSPKNSRIAYVNCHRMFQNPICKNNGGHRIGDTRRRSDCGEWCPTRRCHSRDYLGTERFSHRCRYACTSLPNRKWSSLFNPFPSAVLSQK